MTPFLSTRLMRYAYAAARIGAPGGGWAYRATGECPSCGARTVFVLAERHARWITARVLDWDYSPAFKRDLEIRESQICALCRANARMRAIAALVLHETGAADTAALADRMRASGTLRIYEAA